jgi:hypothetical protein
MTADSYEENLENAPLGWTAEGLKNTRAPLLARNSADCGQLCQDAKHCAAVPDAECILRDEVRESWRNAIRFRERFAQIRQLTLGSLDRAPDCDS